MQVQTLPISGVLVVEPRRHPDERGFFQEIFHAREYAAHGIDADFVQDNWSFSSRGALRGIHYQLGTPQAKLVSVVAGRVFDVAVDLRAGSSTFGKWVGTELSGSNGKQMFVPRGFGHGFLVLSESAHVLYKCDDFYDREDERGVHWSDPDIAIRWPTSEAPIVSPRDAKLPRLADVSVNDLPT